MEPDSVLIVDDDRIYCRAVQRALDSLPCRIEISRGADALRAIASGRIDLAIVTIDAGADPALEVADACQAAGAECILLYGDPGLAAYLDARITEHVCACRLKPGGDLRDLARAARAALERRRLSRENDAFRASAEGAPYLPGESLAGGVARLAAIGRMASDDLPSISDEDWMRLLNAMRRIDSPVKSNGRCDDLPAVLAECVEPFSCWLSHCGIHVYLDLSDAPAPVAVSRGAVQDAITHLLLDLAGACNSPAGITVSVAPPGLRDRGVRIVLWATAAMYKTPLRLGGKECSSPVGLEVARALIAPYGGRIEVETASGVEARIVLWLPAASADQEQLAA